MRSCLWPRLPALTERNLDGRAPSDSLEWKLVQGGLGVLLLVLEELAALQLVQMGERGHWVLESDGEVLLELQLLSDAWLAVELELPVGVAAVVKLACPKPGPAKTFHATFVLPPFL